MKCKSNIRDKQVNLRLSAEEYRRLTEAAMERGIGRAAYLRMVLRGAWLREEAGKSK